MCFKISFEDFHNFCRRELSRAAIHARCNSIINDVISLWNLFFCSSWHSLVIIFIHAIPQALWVETILKTHFYSFTFTPNCLSVFNFYWWQFECFIKFIIICRLLKISANKNSASIVPSKLLRDTGIFFTYMNSTRDQSSELMSCIK